MIDCHQTAGSQRIREAAAVQSDRRRTPRVQADRVVYVKHADPRGVQFEEVRVMRDFSSEGIYFTTDKNSYCKGMQLDVIPGVGCLNLEYVGEVVRVEPLAGLEYGVAVRLLRVRELIVSARTAVQWAYQSFARVNCA
jgi:hypothetical protein